MATRRWVIQGQLMLLLGVSVCGLAFGQTLEAPYPAGGTATCAQKIVPADPYEAAKKYDATEGFEQIAALETLNDQLEARLNAGTIKPEDLFREKIVFYTGIPVTDRSEKAQPMPYKELRLPHAHTGMFIPTGKKGRDIDPTNYKAMIVALPGMGFESSIAQTLFEITGTFNNGTNPALDVGHGVKVRALAIPLDAPLNGMGEKAPFGWGHARGVMAVERHGILIAKILFQPLKDSVFGLGRSQGGLNQVQASGHYTDLRGVVPLNPSPTDPELLQGCIDLHIDMARDENIANARAHGHSCKFHDKSWAAVPIHTPSYDITPASKIPVLLQLGLKDISYPNPQYMRYWQHWADQQPGMRQVRYYNGPHNLWTRMRKDPKDLPPEEQMDSADELFHQTTHDIAVFIAQILGLIPN